MNSSEIYRKNRCIFGTLHKNSLVISTEPYGSDSMMGFKGLFDPFPHPEIRRPIWEGFLLISRPSWLLERSAIFISASNRSANIVIPRFFVKIWRLCGCVNVFCILCVRILARHFHRPHCIAFFRKVGSDRVVRRVVQRRSGSRI